MKIYKALIVDDESPARDIVKHYLKTENRIDIIGECENGFEAVKLIHERKPDMVFLDIQMPKLDGFEMLELIDDSPLIIFCTAYDQYAIQAFDKNAIDYLLKPFSQDRFKEALSKAMAKLDNSEVPEVKQLSEAYHEPLNRIVVKSGVDISILDIENILYIESQDDYVEFHTKDGRKHLKNQRMKYYESALDDSRFVRVHRRFILNITELSKLEKFGKESYIAILKNGENISVSLSGYGRLKEQLDLG